MTIGCRLSDHIAADGSAGARSVFDHERLSELLSDLLEDHTRNNIARDTGRDWYDNGDVARRPILRHSQCERGDQ
jgi:hypothetical protein